MAEKVTIRILDPKGISNILNELHDHWFERQNIRFDKKTGMVIIPFEKQCPTAIEPIMFLPFLKRKKMSVFEFNLIIHHVEKFEIHDEAKINRFDFNDLQFNSSLSQITLTSGFPLKIVLTVRGFEIETQQTDKVIREYLTWTL